MTWRAFERLTDAGTPAGEGRTNMRSKRLIWMLVPAIFAAVTLGGVALAHNVQHPTSLTIEAAGGTITGELRSPANRCEDGMLVRLIRVGHGGTVDRDHTAANGDYEFDVNTPGKYRVRFNGDILIAVHPHFHTCAGSRSDPIEI